ncbi:hypothetical protein C8Q76DRAFT_580459, partial [Earliella scabrosa]
PAADEARPAWHEETGAPVEARLEDLRRAQKFIELIKDATLGNSQMSRRAIKRLRKPLRRTMDLSTEPDLRLSLRMWIANGHSLKAYKDNRDTVLERNLDNKIPSYKKMQRIIRELTGVAPIVTHMCPRSCLAYTGPYAKDTHCSICP